MYMYVFPLFRQFLQITAEIRCLGEKPQKHIALPTLHVCCEVIFPSCSHSVCTQRCKRITRAGWAAASLFRRKGREPFLLTLTHFTVRHGGACFRPSTEEAGGLQGQSQPAYKVLVEPVLCSKQQNLFKTFGWFPFFF